MLYPGLGAGSLEEIEAGLFVDLEHRANRRPETTGAVTLLALLGVAVAGAVKIGRGSTQVGHRSPESGRGRQLADFLEHRVDAAAGEELALVESESAKGAPARTAPRYNDGILDGGKTRDGLRVAGMRGPHEGQLIQGVQVGAVDRECRCLLQQGPFAVHLHQPTTAVRGLLGLDHLGQAHQVVLVGLKLLPGRQDDAVRKICCSRCLAAQKERRAADAGEVPIARLKAADDLTHRRLPHAINQHIGLGVGHNGGLEFVFPVIVMGHAAHGGLHATQHHGCTRKGPTGHLGIDYRCMVGATSRNPASAVHIVLPTMPGGRVVREHRIEVARGDADEEAGHPHALDRLDILPIRLSDDAHAQAHVFQNSTDHRRTERRMVDIRIARDDEYIQFRPPFGGHFLAGHRQEAVVRNLGTACLAGSHSHIRQSKAHRRPDGNQ